MRFLILVLAFLFIGCGRVNTISETTQEGSKGEDGKVIVGQESIVNSSFIGDQKNPNVTRLNNGNILVVFVDEQTFRIKAVWYDINMNRLQERSLYIQNAILDGRPGVTPFNDGFLVCFESLHGVYMAKFNNNGDCIINDTKILETGSDDAMILAINTKDILVVYERNMGSSSGNKDVYRKIINLS